MRLLDLMEPEETVGDLWHRLAEGIGADAAHPEAAVMLADVRGSLAVLFRALGGHAGVELKEAVATRARHRRPLRQGLGGMGEREWVARFDGETLGLPPAIAVFPEAGLNRAAYFRLTALAAMMRPEDLASPADPLERDAAWIRANRAAARRCDAACPGLRGPAARMARLITEGRADPGLRGIERAMETALRQALEGRAPDLPEGPAPRGYHSPAPVPIWLRLEVPGSGEAAELHDADAAAPPGAAVTTLKPGERKDQDQQGRRDSLIVHRFESILSWVESLNINRSVQDDDDEAAQKAAEDHDRITLSKHDRKVATRLRLHLDLSPADARHEALAGRYTYPEWNDRSRSYMDGHCRVLDAPVEIRADRPPLGNPRHVREVRRQFETLRPRRIPQPRQVDGAELDLDALITAQADIRATGRGSDRIWQAARQIDRDLSVAILIDVSRSTEAAIGETSVIEVARQAMAALASGIDAAGDRLAVWAFSSLRRDRVFLGRCKAFDERLGPDTLDRLASLTPGHYTRLGAALRHVSAGLAQESSARKLVIVLTDGKPNDLDHYEGRHGIEDSRMAVREARAAGQALHGIVIDEDGQDWFARIFGRGGFTLLPDPDRLIRVLPEIYRSLTQET